MQWLSRLLLGDGRPDEIAQRPRPDRDCCPGGGVLGGSVLVLGTKLCLALRRVLPFSSDTPCCESGLGIDQVDKTGKESREGRETGRREQ